MKRTNGFVLSAIGVALTLLLTVAAQAAPGATITVTTTADTVADDGECTLREAIQAANTDSAVGGCAAGTDSFAGDSIEFAIPGDGPHTIGLQAALPEITSPLTIDGLSQPGASCESNIPALRHQHLDAVADSTLLIELDGTAAGSTSGLIFADGGMGSVQGLVINRFEGNGVHVRVNDSIFGVGVFCNFIGTDVSGTETAGNGASGVYIQNSPGNSIQSNVIAGNADWGILIEGSSAKDNRVEDNYIGTNASGADLGNGRDGILAQNSGPQVIGGTYTVSGCCVGNTIAFNVGGGVVVSAALNASLEKGIRGNRIYANGGLGIDLENDGVTPNDPGDGDGENSANGLQNFPIIAAAEITTGSVTITGTLNSSAEQSFQVDFFANDTCDPSGYGEGQRFLGIEQVTTDAGGDTTFTATFTGTAASLISGRNLVTATASDPSGNTSEFSECVEATGANAAPANEQLFLPLVQQ